MCWSGSVQDNSHDGDRAGAHLVVVTEAGEESVVAPEDKVSRKGSVLCILPREDRLSQAERNSLQPLPQSSLHRLRDVDALEPQLLPPEDLHYVLPHRHTADVPEGGGAGGDLFYSLHDHFVLLAEKQHGTSHHTQTLTNLHCPTLLSLPS